ncbi:MAG TPA: MBL fold metallo-hydrolase [Candidatus Binataceae bacterium]|jgi:glyoxylase-like metal-dependent hydrolase (beta-lactamase superfamily II)|nr:MBL fold metallo-hydrolase [Candidatus Binataceae bacterium]
MREIVTGVFTWPWFSAPHGYNFNGFLILDQGGNICIDPVEPDADTLAELTRRGAARIILTNRNHVRAANRVRGATGARTAIHPDDAGYARSQGAELDDELRAGQKVGPLGVVAVPGKSPGEVALHWPERRILIAGDAVIGNPPGSCGLLRERVLDDPARLRNSVRELLALDFDTLLVGDGEPILSGAAGRLRDLVESFVG